MNHEKETHFRELVRKIADQDKEICKQRTAKGKEDADIRAAFLKSKAELKHLLAECKLFDAIRDPEIVRVLRAVRDENVFVLDKEHHELKNLIDRYPEATMRILEAKGIKVTDDEVEDAYQERLLDFKREIDERIDMSAFFDRKERWKAIISGKKLPDDLKVYLPDIQSCFLFELDYAAVGLSRVLLEIAFKDRHKTFSPSVVPMDNYPFSSIVREVCERFNRRSLREEANELWRKTSSVLHGRFKGGPIGPAEVVDLIARIASVVENLYSDK